MTGLPPPFRRRTPVNAFSIDKPFNFEKALQVTRGRVALVGKIASHTLYAGRREEVLAETEGVAETTECMLWLRSAVSFR